MIKFINAAKSVIDNKQALKEAIIFATDTKEMFIDVDEQRIKISDIITIATVNNLNNIITPITGKTYFVEENNVFYRHDGTKWIATTNTQEQYNLLLSQVQQLMEAYKKITESIVIDYTILASDWVNGKYTINNAAFTPDCTISLSAPTLTDAQYTALSEAKIIPDDSDFANNNLILEATGTVPTIDIPITITVFIDTNLYGIEDNLTSTSTVNPLSANMGRVLNNRVGDLNTLSTTDKTDTVAAINEIYTNVDAGKNTLATAITNKGIATNATDTFDTMATNITNLLSADTTVQTLVAQVTTTADEVLSGEMFINDLGQAEAGTMPNNVAEQKTLTPGNSYTIAKGYHDGTGIVTAPALKDLTFGTADDYEILAGETAYVNGVEVTGTMPNNTPEQKTLQPGESTTIALGYHDGTGTVSVPTLATLTPGTAEATEILTGETAYVNGAKVTGTMPNNTPEQKKLAPGSSYTIAKGYHDGTGKVTTDPLSTLTTATAEATEILTGETAYVNGNKVTGTMPNNGNINVTLNAGESTTIAKGYHNGSGTVKVNSLASMTPGTADATEILSGETAYVNGNKVTGTMPNNTAEQKTLNPGNSYTIAKGYHDGTGTVSVPTLATLTPGTAEAKEILTGETAYVNGTKVTGTMPNNAAEQKTLQPGETYSIAKGYHDGTGNVSVSSLETLTSGTATADSILAGKTAYVNGNKVTGTMGSNTIYMGSTVPTNDAGEVGDIFLLI